MHTYGELSRLKIPRLTTLLVTLMIIEGEAKARDESDKINGISNSYEIDLPALEEPSSSDALGRRRISQASFDETPELRSGPRTAHETPKNEINLFHYFPHAKSATPPWPNRIYYDTKIATSRQRPDSSKKAPPATIARKTDECAPSPLTPESVRRLVIQSAKRHQVDEVFAEAIAWAESDFDRRRNSPKGARGPMQLMPDTAVRFGVHDICDPAQNIDGAMRYLRVLFDEFQNPLLVAAAYNSGERRVYEHAGIPPFAETVRYLAKVINYQLGLPMPSAKTGPMRVLQTPIEGPAPGNEAGVIAVQQRRQFVGGVMHF